jgi:hypothetical protein
MGILPKKGRRHKLSKHNLKACKKMKKTKGTRGKAKAADIPNVEANDVLSGRGAGVSNHPGNIFYRNLVKNYKLEYSQSNLQRKKEIIRFIIDTIQQTSPPGRFLSQNPNSKEWETVPDDKVQKKTGQALREDAPKIQKMNIISQYFGNQAYTNKMPYHVNDVEILLDQINSREAVGSFPRNQSALPTQPVEPSVAVPSTHSSTPTPPTHPHALSHSPHSWCCSYTPSYQGISSPRNTIHRHQSSDVSPPYHSSQRNLSSSLLEHGPIKREGRASPVWSSAIQKHQPGFKPSYRDGQHPPLHPSFKQKQSHPSGDDKAPQQVHNTVAEDESSNIEPIPFEVTVFTPERQQKTATEKSYPELDDLDNFFFEARIDEALGPFREEEAVESSHEHSRTPQVPSELKSKLFQPKRGNGNP